MMETLEERLRRLGEHVDVELRAWASLDSTPAVDRPESRPRVVHGKHDGIGSAGTPRRRLPRFSPRMLTAAAAVAVVAAGLIAISSRGTDQPAASDPTTVATAGPVQLDAAAASPQAPGADPSVTDSEPASQGDYGPYHWTDADLLSRVYSGLEVGTPDEVAAAFTGQVSPNEIASCMAQASFQYEPDDPLAGDPRWTMSPEEFASQYGLGILAQATGQYPSVTGPNQAYVSSLSEGQRVAYTASLDACSTGDVGTDGLRFLNAYQAAFEQYRGLVTTDERVVDATATWSACMAAAGFDYDNPEQMRSTFWDAFSLSGDELEQRFNEEIAVAVANLPCEAAYTQTVREVAADRLDEFTTMIQSALDSGEVPDAQGIR